MKTKLFAVGLLSIMTLAACSTMVGENEYTDFIYQGKTSQNMQSVIILQHKTNGKMACCRDTEDVTAEECAQALEKECFVRVQDYPYHPAEYDMLKTDTYPSRRWRDNEEAPRW